MRREAFAQRDGVGRGVAAAFALVLGGCLQIGLGTGAGSRTDGGASASTGAATDGGAAGLGCIEVAAAQVTLCEELAACPGVVVDQSMYPECGFRLTASGGLDLECICGDVLCAGGVAGSCASAQELVNQGSALQVCVQRGEGNCSPLGGAPGTAGGTGASSGAQSPCAACAQACGGTPACFQACGC
jgi:hypothetical protein